MPNKLLKNDSPGPWQPGLPFTVHTESLEYEDLVRGLGYATRISREYGLPLTISAKVQMTGDSHGPPSADDIEKLLSITEKEIPEMNIHFGTLDDFAHAVQADNPDLPTIRGDMPDTWIHGLMSNPIPVSERKLEFHLGAYAPASFVLEDISLSSPNGRIK